VIEVSVSRQAMRDAGAGAFAGGVVLVPNSAMRVITRAVCNTTWGERVGSEWEVSGLWLQLDSN
jgi:hypothetical protein